MRWIAFLLLSAVLLLAAACGDGGGEASPTATAPVQPTDTLPPGATDTPAQPEPTEPPAPTAAPVTYEIADREDVSFGATVLIDYRVSVSGPLTERELRRIAQEIIDDETSQQDVNAIGFYFYLPGTDTTGVFTAGGADWAPDGDWESADTVQAGDYSRHEIGAIDLGGALD